MFRRSRWMNSEKREPQLRTARLIMRRWRAEDLDPFAALNADPAVMEHFESGPLTREQSAQFISTIEEEFDEKGWGLWAIEVPGVAPLIGFVGLHRIPFDAPFMPAVEVGWRLARAHWGRGYAPEAALAAVAFGYDRAGLTNIVSMTSIPNVRSQRVMEKIGMVRDPEEDFDHPRVSVGHPVRRHVLYRFPPGVRPPALP